MPSLAELAALTANPQMLAQAKRAREAYPRKELTLAELINISSFLPGVGDAIGLGVDAHRFATEPESRTVPGVALSALGLLPFVPSASAMKRAKDMGMDVTRRWYHGTDRGFEQFDDKHLGAVTGQTNVGKWMAEAGHFASDNPQVAREFSENAARVRGGTPHVRELFVSKEGQGIIDIRGSKTQPHELAATLLNARDQGVRTVVLRGVPDSVSGKISDVLVIMDPGAVRDVKAKFDPALKGSASLLAGLTGLGFGVSLLGKSESP